MVKHWSGQFKNLDSGAEDYEIPAKVWDVIWQETADAVRHIPAAFVRVLGSNPSYYTAEAWCFWIVYLAPALLKGRFRHEKYYTHACQFSKIIKHCIGFEITYDQIDRLEDDIIDWVQKYEEYYYQYDESRLSACPLTIHAWLHQLGARYDLEDELSTRRVYDKSALSRSERAYDGYAQAILRAPYKSAHIPDDITRKRIAGYFSAALGKKQRDIRKKLPEVMPRWGKVRIVDGDSIRSTSACAGESSDVTERDMSFARYELQVKAHDDTWITRVFYGRLEEILVCELPDDPLWLDMAATTRLLVVITPCSTSGKDAAQESTFYTQMTTPIVTDIRTIIAVVGRIKTRAEWMIIDRSGSPIHPEFVPQDL
ncbi:hypothetical protein FB451DRAFT_1057037 [Mycena latifolia]|nr:hypothetical protein FB451DRAFT_1057037 [Mycena latifolia]